MFCTKCGSQTAAGSRFCGVCGAALAVDTGAAASPLSAPTTPSWAGSLAPAGSYRAPGYAYAGFWRRWVAAMLDNLVLLVGLIVLFIFLSALAPGPDGGMSDTAGGFAFLIAIMGTWIYFAWMESSPYQATLGKMALGIIVTDDAGRRISFARASGRYWAKTLSYLTFWIGYIMAGFTARKQALHDLLASTLVVVKR